MAERAGERAADLARDAQRPAIALGDVDALDFRAHGPAAHKAIARRGRHPDQPLARTVAGHLLGDDLRTLQRVLVGELLPERLGDVEHAVEIAHAVEIDPVPELADPHPRLPLGHAHGLQGSAQLRPRVSDERRLMTSGALGDLFGGAFVTGEHAFSGSRAGTGTPAAPERPAGFI